MIKVPLTPYYGLNGSSGLGDRLILKELYHVFFYFKGELELSERRETSRVFSQAQV